MAIKEHDYGKLAFAVRQFVQGASFQASMSVLPTLVLEFPDMATMHDVHMQILRTTPELTQYGAKQGWSQVDSNTIRYKPFAGVTIVLHCTERLSHPRLGEVGYTEVRFVSSKLLPKED